MTTPKPSKICQICHEDCSTRPRIKDPNGHYYCRQCYEQARAHGEGSTAPSPPQPQVPSLHDDDDLLALVDDSAGPASPQQPTQSSNPTDDVFARANESIAAPGGHTEAAGGGDMIDALTALARQEQTTPIAAGGGCRRCGSQLAPGAVVCVNCGMNVQSGTALTTTKRRTKTIRTGSGSGEIWPLVIGILSAMIGLGGVVLYGVQVLAVPPDTEPAREAGRMGAAILSIGMSTLLLASGICIALRRPGGVTAIRVWAIIKIVLVALLATCVGVLLIIGKRAMSSEELGAEFGMAMSLIGVVVLALVLFHLAWPVFILWWFRRDKVQRDIDMW